MSGDEDDGWKTLAKGELDPVESWHLNVQENNVGGELVHALDGFLTILCFATDRDPADAFQHADEAAPGEHLVINDKRPHAGPLRGSTMRTR